MESDAVPRRTTFRMRYSVSVSGGATRKEVLWTPEAGHADMPAFARFLVAHEFPNISYRKGQRGMEAVLRAHGLTNISSPDIEPQLPLLKNNNKNFQLFCWQAIRWRALKKIARSSGALSRNGQGPKAAIAVAKYTTSVCMTRISSTASMLASYFVTDSVALSVSVALIAQVA